MQLPVGHGAIWVLSNFLHLTYGRTESTESRVGTTIVVLGGFYKTVSRRTNGSPAGPTIPYRSNAPMISARSHRWLRPERGSGGWLRSSMPNEPTGQNRQQADGREKPLGGSGGFSWPNPLRPAHLEDRSFIEAHLKDIAPQ